MDGEAKLEKKANVGKPLGETNAMNCKGAKGQRGKL